MATVAIDTFSQLPAPVLPEQLESSEEYRNVLSMTQRLFPGPVGVRRERDPELPEEYLVFDVRAKGALEQIMSLDAQWHRECGKLAPAAWYLYGLAIAVENDSE